MDRFGAFANGYNYGVLLRAPKDKNMLEAQFVSYFDKFDGAGEAWHEVWAGNHHFILPAGGRNAHNGGYVRRLNEFPTRYPLMKQFFEQFTHYLPPPFAFAHKADLGRPHTTASLLQDSGYLPYERWKQTIIKHEGIDRLITEQESSQNT